LNMKLGFVVNNVKTESAAYTRTRLAMTATNLGHESWTLGVGDFSYAPDGSLYAHARGVHGDAYDDLRVFMAELQGNDARCERIRVDDLDVLLLRNDPAEDATAHPWTQTSGILFGRLAVERGVMVVNDPEDLATAINTASFQPCPEQVRPRTCISRNVKDIQDFIEQHRDGVVIKPLQGWGGQNVFFIKESDRANQNQMIEA